MNTGDKVCVRTELAGVFVGVLKNYNENIREATLEYARRIYFWSGASTLSELSQKGVAKPNECKFPVVVPWVLLPQVKEILPVSDKAWNSIMNVPIWTSHPE